MYKAFMRDNLGWMKDEKFVTGSVKELVGFVEYYGAAVAPDELEKLDKKYADDYKTVYNVNLGG